MLARLPVVVLFAAAIAGAAVALHLLSLTAAMTTTVVLSLTAFALIRRSTATWPGLRSLGVICAVLALAVASGALSSWRYASTQQALPDERDVVDCEGEVTDDMAADYGRRLTLRLHEGGSAYVRLYIDVDVRAGDVIRVRGRLRRPGAALSPGTYDASLAARARDVHAVVSIYDADDVTLVSRGTAPLLVQARQMLRERLQVQVSERLAGLLLALLIGDTSLFDDEQRSAYRHVGASHLLAVSGLQVTLLAVVLRRVSAGLAVLIPGGRRRRGLRAAGLCALVGVWAFVGLCGMPPSAVRAGIMASVVVVASTLGRRVLLIDAIAAAGLATTLLSPTSVDDAGFLLSYAAVTALAATSVDAPMPETVSLSLRGQLAAAWRTFRPTIIASLTAGFATLPISAWLFGQAAPAGLVANIVLVPVASVLQLPALLCGVVGAVTDISAITWLGGQAALLLDALVFGLSDVLPGARMIEPPSSIVAVLLLALSLLAGSLAIMQRRRALLGTIIVAAAVVVASGYEGQALRVTFLPVGQGDAAVVEMPGGEVMVVDAGGRVPFDPNASPQARASALAEPGLRVVVPFLERRGIDHVDVMIASHPHPDHVGGLLPVAQTVPVSSLWMAGDADNAGRLMAPLIAAVGRAQVHSTPSLLGTHTFSLGATVDVLAPAPAEGGAVYPELHTNDNSLVVRVCWRGRCVLLPGDVETFGEELLLDSLYAAQVKADVVKAPHHGSKTSSTPALVAATQASHVVLCTGRHNTFGFPSPEVVSRWRGAGAKAWDTARDGEIVVRIRPDGGLSVSGYAAQDAAQDTD